MEFASIQILILGGTAAVLIPVLIQLFNRTKFHVTNWAAMEFLLAALKKTRRRVRIENLLLLFLRILALLFLALMLARPSVEGQVSVQKRTHHVIVLDNSYSMGTRYDEQTHLDRAKALIELMISKELLGENDALTLIRTSETLADFSRGETIPPPTVGTTPISATGTAGTADGAAGAADGENDDDNGVSETELRARVDELRTERATVRQEIDAAEAEIGSIRESSTPNMDRLATLQTQIAEAKRTLLRLDEQITEAQARLAEKTGGPTARPDSSPAAENPLFTTHRDVIQRMVRETQVVYSDSDWLQTLNLADRALSESKPTDFTIKRLVVFTDMQKRNFPTANDPRLPLFRTALGQIREKVGNNLQFVDVGTPAFNRTIVSAKLRDPVVGVGVPIHLEVTVRNNSVPRDSDGDETQNTFAIRYATDGGRDRPLFEIKDVKPGQTKTEAYSGTLDAFTTPGTHYLELMLENDDLEIDNRYFLVVDVRESIDILVVDGKPGEKRSDSETYYFMVAVPGVSERLRTERPQENFVPKTFIRARLVPYSNLSGIDFFEYDMVLLANVPQLWPPEVRALERFVRSGRSAIITLGDRVDADKSNPQRFHFYHSLMWNEGRGLLPLKVAGEVMSPTSEERLKMVPVEPFHRAIRGLAEQDRDHNTNFMQQPSFFQFIGFEWGAQGDARIRRIVDLNKSVEPGTPAHPLLFTSRYGDGQVVVFASSLDGRWDYALSDGATPGARSMRGNTMPAFAMYIAFWQELIYALSESSTDHKRVAVGQPYRRPISPEEYSQNNFVFPPNANEIELDEGLLVPVRNVTRAERDNAFRGELLFTDTHRSGIYTLKILKQRDSLRALVRDMLESEVVVPPTARRQLADSVTDALMRMQETSSNPETQKTILVELLADDQFGIAVTSRESLADRVLLAVAPAFTQRELRSVVDRFAVNLPTEESDLEKLAPTAEAMREALRERFPEVPIDIKDGTTPFGSADPSASGIGGPPRSQIWKFVGMILLVFLALEMMAALLFTSRQR